jgi:hypothetical protein
MIALKTSIREILEMGQFEKHPVNTKEKGVVAKPKFSERFCVV